MFIYAIASYTHITDNLIYHLPTGRSNVEQKVTKPRKKKSNKKDASSDSSSSDEESSTTASDSEEIMPAKPPIARKKQRKSDQVISPSGMPIYTHFVIFKYCYHSILYLNFSYSYHNIQQYHELTINSLFKLFQNVF